MHFFASVLSTLTVCCCVDNEIGSINLWTLPLISSLVCLLCTGDIHREKLFPVLRLEKLKSYVFEPNEAPSKNLLFEKYRDSIIQLDLFTIVIISTRLHSCLRFSNINIYFKACSQSVKILFYNAKLRG
jgi:hypothetical protein